MDFVVVVVVFALFFAGMVFVIQGFVGREIYPPAGLHLRADFDRPGISHPPERHRARLMAVGAGMMVLAVLLGLLVI